jgi:hypothetical protein
METIMNKHYNKTLFQGSKKMHHKNYFEGWYFKQVTKDKEFVISFIPGMSTNVEDPHAFVQCIFKDRIGMMKSLYFRYPLETFKYEDDPFSVTIGNNIFKETGVTLDLVDTTYVISGSLTYSNLTPLRKRLIEPNIMGFFSYVPGLECNHDIISMSHEVMGQLSINEDDVIFDHGKGYIEKDWGTSFPEKYIWIQSNHFLLDDMSICCSIASFPVLKLPIQGFFCNLKHNGSEYRFATYNGSRIKAFGVNNKDYNIIIANKKYTLQLKGQLSSSESLVAPNNGKMSYTIKEGLSGIISVVLKSSDGKIIINEHSNHCGIEIVGY